MSEALLSEATMDDLYTLFKERFGTFIFYGDNHDPSLGEDGDIVTAVGGPAWKREGLMNIINQDFITEVAVVEYDKSDLEDI